MMKIYCSFVPTLIHTQYVQCSVVVISTENNYQLNLCAILVEHCSESSVPKLSTTVSTLYRYREFS